MGGGLMQLVAYGAQDVYLSGSPQITFFKVVYRRHTNFAVEPIQQVWNGAADFGRTVTCNINRNGDLITNMYLAVTLNATPSSSVAWGYVNRLGNALIEETKVEIGGQKIDEQYGDWLNIWYELTHKTGQERGYAKLIGDVPNLTSISSSGKRAYNLYVPLQYWFNRNNGLALPLIALQYHDVRMTVQFQQAINCLNWVGSVQPSTANLMADSYLLIDYVYLDSEERKRFAQASHEYLIEQLQFTGSESLSSTNNKYRLNFNHPCKYLIWAPHLERYNNRAKYVVYPTASSSSSGSGVTSSLGRTDWVAATALFSKLVFLASNLATATTVRTVDASGNLQVEGEVVTPVANVSNCLLASVAAKVNAKLVVSAVGQSGTQPASVNDVVLLSTDVQIEDMSNTLDALVAGGTNVANASTFLNTVAVNAINPFNYGNFLDGTDNPVVQGKLQLNGQDRFQVRDGNYFNYVQPWQHFSNTPADGINVYSFALKPEEHQPSGSCNFSRIDNATLQVDVGTYNAPSSGYGVNFLGTNSNSLLNIYTVNYNVLRVMSGMAGTAYSN